MIPFSLISLLLLFQEENESSVEKKSTGFPEKVALRVSRQKKGV
jgi:hypothetical protein